MKQQSKKSKAFLVGPFIGELSWEFYRFAPYIIHLKKEDPYTKLIVFTRPTRFDLYGKYADILVSLKLPDENKSNQYCFTSKGFTQSNYKLLIKSFTDEYKKRYKIRQQIYPDISSFYYKLKWQFPRELMDYDFKPRKVNAKIVDEYVGKNSIVLVDPQSSINLDQILYLESIGHSPIFTDIFYKHVQNEKQKTFSFIGCIIELLRRCDFIISNVDSIFSRLALILGTPVISIGESISPDVVSLLNPNQTPVIITDEIEAGVNIWREKINENNF